MEAVFLSSLLVCVILLANEEEDVDAEREGCVCMRVKNVHLQATLLVSSRKTFGTESASKCSVCWQMMASSLSGFGAS